VDWAALLAGARRVDLPTYAFQRQRYWPKPLDLSALGGDGAGSAAEARFWAAVEGGDLQALAETLATDDADRLAQALPVLASWRRRERDRSETEGWRYEVTWAPVPDPDPASLSGTWLVVTPPGLPDDGMPDDCVQAMTARGAQVTVIEEQDLTARIGQLTGLSGVVSLLALAEAAVPAHPAVPVGLAGTQALVQALGEAGIAAPLWVLTRGAGPDASPVQAMTWGLGRVVALEHPDRWGGLIDLPPVLDERSAARLCTVLAGCGEDQVAIRPAGILARRLARAPRPVTGTPWVPRGTVLVTGGTGAIGGHVARWLAHRGAGHLALASRSGPAAKGAAVLAAELAAAGAQVNVVSCDMAERAELSALLTRIAASGPPLSAVMHAAGIGQATAVADTSVAELAEVVTAKIAGAALLDELTEGLDLDGFVLFSSISATWGSGLQPAYAAGNALLDALAAHRRARGLAGTSVAWGPWAGGGLTDAEGGAQLQRRGLTLMDPALAVRALGQVLDGGEALVTVADVDWARFAPAFTVRRPSPLIAGLPEVSQVLAATADSAPAEAQGVEAELRQRLAALPPAERGQVITDLVRTEAAAVLGHASAEAVEPSRAFKDLGFDSLTAVELRNRLTAATGLRLPATLVFDYPTLAALAEHLRAVIADDAPAPLPVLAELDKLESMLSAVPGGNAESATITARLDAVVSKWKELRAQIGGDTVVKKLESSTDDEVFDFIGKKLEYFDPDKGPE
jgi:NAD(P)-dependent dehydrogenase (short-subunit alcohol dehydrogenase family)/acyl carrier protein